MSQVFATAAPSVASHAPSVRAYSDSRRAMHLTMQATFLFFLAATLARRLNPFARDRETRQTIVAETRARAAAIIPFIFMG